MTIGNGTIAVFLHSRRFYKYWRILERSNNSYTDWTTNLTLRPRIFFQNVSRCMSVAYSILPENDVKKFFEYLIKAYKNGNSTDFDKLLEYHPIKKLLNERMNLLDSIKSVIELAQNSELATLAREERETYELQLKKVDDELSRLILENLGKEHYDDIILEITAGVGGQEAMLFVKDLLEMYIKHIGHLGFSYDIIDLDDSEKGGVRHASLMISGRNAFHQFKHEGGVHRVQRVPATEKSGRIHTSVVSVAILPQPSEIDIQIDPKDLRIDTMRASGAGGQHVNTTNSAVRIVHIPSGTVAECQTNRSQMKNKELAMAKLRAKIYQEKLDKQLKSTKGMRKQQMGSGERHEKIRTYNYPQDRITDHRLSNCTMHNLEGFLKGGGTLEKLHVKLQQIVQHKMLLEAIKDLE
ncbi:peptide chain release factor 1-like, mitochondrial [Phymastichus coffea]|uniref:peptide chain release factor 1-like, mitochondrial n=1 Tax=Phymastichus coffea TaxID=108790 RepID=UPI00273A7EF0|nr:peptide chain release factor 1-like, mitochondrial [Phymastichus coffea]